MAITTVTLSTIGGGSVVSPANLTGQYGRTVLLTANPDPGFRFVKWNITRIEADPAPVESPVAAPPPVEAPAPVAAPVAAPVEAPVAAPVEAPVAAPVAAPVEAPVAAPVAAPVEAPVAAPVEAPVAAPVAAPVEAPVEAPVAAPVFVLAPFTINLGQCGGNQYGTCPPGSTCKGTFNSFQNGFTGTSVTMTFECEPIPAPEAPVAAPEAAPQAPTTQIDINDAPPPAPTGGGSGGGSGGGFFETNTQF